MSRRPNRRRFIGSLGVASAAAVAATGIGTHSIRLGADLSAASPAAGGQAAANYDLVIKGGRVIDPSQNLSAVRDVAIANGKIAAVGENITARQGHEDRPGGALGQMRGGEGLTSSAAGAGLTFGGCTLCPCPNPLS